MASFKKESRLVKGMALAYYGGSGIEEMLEHGGIYSPKRLELNEKSVSEIEKEHCRELKIYKSLTARLAPTMRKQNIGGPGIQTASDEMLAHRAKRIGLGKEFSNGYKQLGMNYLVMLNRSPTGLKKRESTNYIFEFKFPEGKISNLDELHIYVWWELSFNFLNKVMTPPDMVDKTRIILKTHGLERVAVEAFNAPAKPLPPNLEVILRKRAR